MFLMTGFEPRLYRCLEWLPGQLYHNHYSREFKGFSGVGSNCPDNSATTTKYSREFNGFFGVGSNCPDNSTITTNYPREFKGFFGVWSECNNNSTTTTNYSREFKMFYGIRSYCIDNSTTITTLGSLKGSLVWGANGMATLPQLLLLGV